MNAPLLKGCGWTSRWAMLSAWRALPPSPTRHLKASRLYAKKGMSRRVKTTRTEAPSEIREISGSLEEPPIVIDEVTASEEEEVETLSVAPPVEAEEEENEIGVVNSVAPVVEESSFDETPPVDEHVESVFHETVDPMPLHTRILSSMDWGAAGMGTGIAAAILGALFVGRSFAQGDSSRNTLATTIHKVIFSWTSVVTSPVFCLGNEILQATERGRSSIE